MRKISRIVVILTLVFSLYENTVPVYALPAVVSLSMTRREQEESNWCWAASAQMIGEYYGNRYTQSIIVYQIKNSYANAGASDSEVSQAFNFVLPQGRKAVSEDTKTQTFLQTKLAQGYPIPIKMLWNGGGAHSVILSGYESDGKLTITDPGIGCNRRSSYAYSSLIAGTRIQSGNGRYVKTWVIN